MEVKNGARSLISAKISAKGQITLPRKIRKLLAVGPGDRLLFVVEGDAVALRSLGACSAQALSGSLRQYARKANGHGKVRAEVKKGMADAAAREG
jgi:AbrB family looped-hinge helix DNA binding protein